ncbi:Gustatory receptor 22 [Cephus cinctus]|nr:Gustatory receptor 22 [Cephus cinctus]
MKHSNIWQSKTQEKWSKMNLESAMRPLHYTSRFLGLNISGKLNRVYALSILLIFCAIIYSSSTNLCNLICSENGVNNFILWIQYIANTLFVFVVIISTLIKPLQFAFPHEDLRMIDRNFRYIGVNFSDKHVFKIQLLQVIISILTPMLFGWRDVKMSIHLKSINAVLYYLHYYYAVTISMVTDFLFVNYLGIIKIRYSHLNHLITQLVEEKLSPPVSFSNLSQRQLLWRDDNSYVFYKIKKIRRLHHDLFSLSMKINKNFGICILVNSTISLIIITGQLYANYYSFNGSVIDMDLIVYNLLWTLYYTFRLVFVSYACHRTQNEANMASLILCGISLPSKAMQDEVLLFSLQLMQENLIFTACDFFNIDLTMLSSVVSTITTYLVILIQLDRTKESSEDTNTQKHF